MSVRVTVEGGGSFELDDTQVEILRDSARWGAVPFGASGKKLLDDLHAALPPEPYQPKEGDRINYRHPDRSDGSWSGPRVYLGQWKDCHVVSLLTSGPVVVPPDTEFRRADA